VNNIGGGWMGGNAWGWTSATSGTVYYPTAITITADGTNDAPAPPRKRTPVEWLRDQIDEITAVAVA
jgi:hypothetical protein